DPLAIGLGRRQLTRVGSHGQQDRRGVECVFGASGLDDVDLVAAGEGGSALDDFDSGPDEAVVGVVGLRIGQGQDPLVHGLEVGGAPTHIGLAVLSVRDPNSQTVGAADVVHHLGGGD